MHSWASSSPSVPVGYVCQLLDLVDDLGGSGAGLWAALGLDARALDNPLGRLPLAHYTALHARALAACDEPGLGYLLGLRASPASHGTLAFGMMSQPTLAEALMFGVRLGGPLRLAGWMLHHVAMGHGGQACVQLRLSETLSPPRAPALRQHAARLMLTGMATLLGHVLPGCQPDLVLHFEGPEPDWQHRHAARLPRCRFQQPFAALSLPARLLPADLPQANAPAARWAEQTCTDELMRLGETPAARVRRQAEALLAASDQGYLSAGEVAAHLGLSVRTLARTLRSTGCTFQALLKQARQRDALALLQVPDLPLATVARHLGYRSISAFGDAFQGWAGQPPAAFRTSPPGPVEGPCQGSASGHLA